jgi:hypothetical protein
MTPRTITVPLGKTVLLFAGIFVGLLLLVIGLDQKNDAVYYAGAFILPAALLWGSLFLGEESPGIRIALLAVGGFLIAALLAGFHLFG